MHVYVCMYAFVVVKYHLRWLRNQHVHAYIQLEKKQIDILRPPLPSSKATAETGTAKPSFYHQNMRRNVCIFL